MSSARVEERGRVTGGAGWKWWGWCKVRGRMRVGGGGGGKVGLLYSVRMDEEVGGVG